MRRRSAGPHPLRLATYFASGALAAALAGGCSSDRPLAIFGPAEPGVVGAVPLPTPEPLVVPELGPGQLRACGLSFHSPHELDAFREALPEEDFVFTDLSPVFPDGLDSSGSTLARKVPGWFRERCRPDLRCDILILSAEFAGAFFGSYGFYLPLQEMEEASCEAQCKGIFSDPSEVFLMACNTLATKNADRRTPEEYYHVLLEHGFSHTDAQRVVAVRYGPLGPSFRESLRRVFIGVPRVYGFSSVAPLGQFTAPRLRQYFKRKGDYAEYLEKVGRDDSKNKELLSAFAGTGMVQTTGVSPDDDEGTDRNLVCEIYDADESVSDRLRVVKQLFEREDFLSFIPTIEVFFDRNPPHQYKRKERRLFGEIQELEAPREEVTELVQRLDLSVVKMQLANLARQLDWISAEEHEQIAAEGLKQLLAQPLSSEVADIGCELGRHTPTGAALRSEDIPDQLLWHAEGYRMLDCLAPTDPAITSRMVSGLGNIDEGTRIWAAYALWRRRPLDDEVLIAVAPRLNDSSPEVRERLRKIFRTQAPLSSEVSEAIRERDPDLADALATRD